MRELGRVFEPDGKEEVSVCRRCPSSCCLRAVSSLLLLLLMSSLIVCLLVILGAGDYESSQVGSSWLAVVVVVLAFVVVVVVTMAHLSLLMLLPTPMLCFLAVRVASSSTTKPRLPKSFTVFATLGGSKLLPGVGPPLRDLFLKLYATFCQRFPFFAGEGCFGSLSFLLCRYGTCSCSILVVVVVVVVVIFVFAQIFSDGEPTFSFLWGDWAFLLFNPVL